MGLDPGEQHEAKQGLHQAQQGGVPGLGPADQQKDEAGQRHGQQEIAEVAAEHHRIHPAALVIGGIGVEIVGGQHLLHHEALSEIEGAYDPRAH